MLCNVDKIKRYVCFLSSPPQSKPMCLSDEKSEEKAESEEKEREGGRVSD